MQKNTQNQINDGRKESMFKGSNFSAEFLKQLSKLSARKNHEPYNKNPSEVNKLPNKCFFGRLRDYNYCDTDKTAECVPDLFATL